MMKRILITLLIILSCFAVFAEDYKIIIKNAESVKTYDDVFELSGNVVLDFSTTDEGGKNESHTLTAGSVKIDTEKKTIQASENVVLKHGEDSFKGESVILEWDDLDVVVYGGSSASERQNAGGDSVTFHARGQRISYAGGENTVFFSDGVISTTEKDPYWSVKASNIGLLESDLFFENATVRIGRVPVLWVPFFFYPGTTLAFNPSIGLSSTRGMFLNTTTEVYGKYPGRGTMGGSASSGNETDETVASILSFMETDEGDVIRDGLIYRPVAQVEMTEFEKNARAKGNYFVLFADIYEKNGPALGYETKNKFGNFNFASSAIMGYNNRETNYPEYRYASENSASFSYKNTKFSLNIPFYSDPQAPAVYLNRNSAFELTSILGNEQYFPSSHSSVSSYRWNLDSSSNFNLFKKKVNVNSLKGEISYSWNSKDKKFEVANATFPYVSLSSSGSIFSWTGKSKSKSTEVGFASETARDFNDEFTALTIPTSTDYVPVVDIKPLDGPSYSTSKTKNFSAPYLKSSYSYKQTLTNLYSKNMIAESLATDASGSLNLSGRLPYNLLTMDSSVSPAYKYKQDKRENGILTQSLSVPASLKFSLPFINITYGISGTVYKADAKEKEWTEKKFEFTKDYVSSHYLEGSRTIGKVKLSLKATLKPVTQSMVPSLSFSSNGFSMSASSTLYSKEEKTQNKKTDTGTLNFSYSHKSGKFSATLNNSFDFSKKDFEGYTGSQTMTIVPLKGLTITESMKLAKKFEIQSATASATYKNTKGTINFKGKDLELDNMSLSSNFSIQPKYFWKNRVGFSSSVNSSFSYDFKDKYGASFSLVMSLDFAVKDFLSVKFSVKTANTSFFRYYEDDKFKPNLVWKDLVNSLSVWEPEKRRDTGFNLSSYSLNIVHYMEDWDLTVNAGTSIITVNGNPAWNPQVSVYMKWRAIPEIKVDNTWTQNKGWSK